MLGIMPLVVLEDTHLYTGIWIQKLHCLGSNLELKGLFLGSILYITTLNSRELYLSGRTIDDKSSSENRMLLTIGNCKEIVPCKKKICVFIRKC